MRERGWPATFLDAAVFLVADDAGLHGGVLGAGLIAQLFLEFHELGLESSVAGGDDLRGQYTRVARAADGDGGNGNATGHLNDGEQ